MKKTKRSQKIIIAVTMCLYPTIDANPYREIPCPRQPQQQTQNTQTRYKKLQEQLDAGNVDPNRRNTQGTTPLIEACKTGSPQIASLLLAHGASPELLDKHGNTPKDYAKTNTIRAALENPIYQPISYIIHGQPVEVKHLAQQGLSINACDATGRTLLSWACEYGNNRATRELIDHHASIHIADTFGRSPAHYAAKSDNLHCLAKLLIKNPSLVHQKDRIQRTPLLYAVTENKRQATRLLLACGADPNKPDERGKTALAWAATKGSIESLNILISTPGICIEQPNKKGTTPLSWAISYGNLKAIQALINADANPRHCDQDGTTGLDWAQRKFAPQEYEKIKKHILFAQQVKALQSKEYQDLSQLLTKTNLNLCDENGDTLAHYAVKADDLTALNILLHNEVPISMPNKNNETPFDLARSTDNSNSATLLSWLGKKQLCTSKSPSGLKNAIAQKEFKSAQDFVFKTAEIINNPTVLHQLVYTAKNMKQSGQLNTETENDILRLSSLLILFGADYTALDENEKTPSCCAQQAGLTKLECLLNQSNTYQPL